MVKPAQAVEDARRLMNEHKLDLIFAGKPGAVLVPAVQTEALFTVEARE